MNEQAVGSPLRRRIARHPDRRPRDSMLYDLERVWRDVQPQKFRLEFKTKRQGKLFFISERAVTVLDPFRLTHWNDHDYGVAVMETWVEVNRDGAQAGFQSRMWIGSHAIARWYQRSALRSDDRLLRDIALGAAIDANDRMAFPNLDDVRVPVNVAGEGWRGAIMLSPEDEGDILVFHARTFI